MKCCAYIVSVSLLPLAAADASKHANSQVQVIYPDFFLVFYPKCT